MNIIKSFQNILKTISKLFSNIFKTILKTFIKNISLKIFQFKTIFLIYIYNKKRSIIMKKCIL